MKNDRKMLRVNKTEGWVEAAEKIPANGARLLSRSGWKPSWQSARDTERGGQDVSPDKKATGIAIGQDSVTALASSRARSDPVQHSMYIATHRAVVYAVRGLAVWLSKIVSSRDIRRGNDVVLSTKQ